METLEWYELGYFEEEDFDDEDLEELKEKEILLNRPCPLGLTDYMVRDALYEDFDFYYTSVFKDEYNYEVLEKISYERLIKKFENATPEQLDGLRKRALAYIIESFVRKSKFYAYNDWLMIRKEMLVKSNAKEFICETIDEVLEGDIYLKLPDYADKVISKSSIYNGLQKTKGELQTSISSVTKEHPDDSMVEGYVARLNEDIIAIDNGISSAKSYIIDDEESYNDQKAREKQEVKADLEVDLKKKFGRDFIVSYFYPNRQELSNDLIDDIYFAVSDTENWKMSTPAFKEEFDGILKNSLSYKKVK